MLACPPWIGMGRAAEDSGACGAGANDRPARAAPRSLGGCGGGAPPSKSKALPPGFEPPGGSPGPPTRAMKEVDGREAALRERETKKSERRLAEGPPTCTACGQRGRLGQGPCLTRYGSRSKSTTGRGKGLEVGGNGRRGRGERLSEASKKSGAALQRSPPVLLCVCALGGSPRGRAWVGWGVGGGGRSLGVRVDKPWSGDSLRWQRGSLPGGGGGRAREEERNGPTCFVLFSQPLNLTLSLLSTPWAPPRPFFCAALAGHARPPRRTT